MQFHEKSFWFIWFHEFFCLDFFKFSGPLCIVENSYLWKKRYISYYNSVWFRFQSCQNRAENELISTQIGIFLTHYRYCLSELLTFFSNQTIIHWVCVSYLFTHRYFGIVPSHSISGGGEHKALKKWQKMCNIKWLQK